MVEDGVDHGGHEVQDAGQVRDEVEDVLEALALLGGLTLVHVDGHEPLRVERRPAHEEGQHHGHCGGREEESHMNRLFGNKEKKRGGNDWPIS